MNYSFTKPSWSKSWLRIISIASIVFVFFSGSGVLAADSFKFTFNPGNVKCTLDFKTTKIKKQSQGSQTDVATGKASIQYMKTANGYTIVQTPVSFSLTRNGKPPGSDVGGMVQKIAGDTVVTYETDAKGELKAIKGFEALVEKIQSIFAQADPTIGEKLQKMMPSIIQSAIAKENAEWNGRISAWVGQTGEIGDIWEIESDVEIPMLGMYTVASRAKLVGRVQCGGRNCVKMILTSNPDSKTFTAALNKMLTQMMKSTGTTGVQFKITNAKLTDSAVRVFDPSTMLMYSETMNRTVTMTLVQPGKGKEQTSLTEKKEYRYTYSN